MPVSPCWIAARLDMQLKKRSREKQCLNWLLVLSLRRHDPDQVPDRSIDQGSGKSHLSRMCDTPWNGISCDGLLANLQGLCRLLLRFGPGLKDFVEHLGARNTLFYGHQSTAAGAVLQWNVDPVTGFQQRFILLFRLFEIVERNQENAVCNAGWYADQMVRTLVPGGQLNVATDHDGYWEALEPVFDEHEGFERLPEFGGPDFPVPSDGPLTNFEAKYAIEGRNRHRASWRRR